MDFFFVYQKEQTTGTSLATLPSSFQALAPQATEYCLAYVALPPGVSLGKGGGQDSLISLFITHYTFCSVQLLKLSVVYSLFIKYKSEEKQSG